MKHARLIVLVALGAALVGGSLVYKVKHNSARAAEYKTKATDMVKLADAYKADPVYISGLLEGSFAPAGKAGSGWLFSGFNEDRYYTALFQNMVNQAKKDGKPEVAKLIRNFAVGKNFQTVTDR